MTSPRRCLPEDVVLLSSIAEEAVTSRPRRALIEDDFDDTVELAEVVHLPARGKADPVEKRRRAFRRKYVAPAVVVATVAGVVGGMALQPSDAAGSESADQPELSIGGQASATVKQRELDSTSRSQARQALDESVSKAAAAHKISPKVNAGLKASMVKQSAPAPKVKAQVAYVPKERFCLEAVYLRETASAKTKYLQTIDAGEKVIFTGQVVGSWSEVEYKGRHGWITSRFLVEKMPESEALGGNANGTVSQGAGGGGASNQSYAPSGSLARPSNGAMTSPYGMRMHPIFHVWKMHTGVDFAASCGSPLYAAGNGVVKSRGWVGGYGNQMIIDLGNVGGRNIEVSYNHAQGFSVSPGQSVSKGQVIGYMGSTGNSTGCHLHFEAFVNGTRVNPMSLY